MNAEIPSPKPEKITPKKIEAPQKTPTKKIPVKRKTPQSSAKAKAPKVSPAKPASKVKTELVSSAKEKVKNEDEMETDEAEDDTSKPNTSAKNDEKPKAHPFFSKPKPLSASDGALYDPGKANYHPIKDCFWKHGEK